MDHIGMDVHKSRRAGWRRGYPFTAPAVSPSTM